MTEYDEDEARDDGAEDGLAAFVRDIARLTQDGEVIDGGEFVMENDDAVDTLNNLIGRARELLGGLK